MTLVERYVRAVRDFLPRGQQDDITNELSDSIQSRFEDEAAARGRPLTEDEQVAILRSLGHPMAVAARYRGDDRSVRFGGQLIGPELFPTYLTVLRINLAITLIIGAVSLIVGGSIWSAIAGVVVPFVIQFTIVTLVFIWVERRWLRDPDGWDPRTVNSMGPDVDVSTLDGLAVQLIGKQHTRAVAVTTSVLEIGLLAIALTAWLAIGLPEQIAFMKPGSRLDRRVARGHRGDPVRARHPGRQPVPADLDALPGCRPRADGHRLDRDPRGLAHAGQLGRPRRSGHCHGRTSRTSSS